MAAAVRVDRPSDVPPKAEEKIKEAWLRWRIMVRTHQKEAAEGAATPAAGLNLMRSVEDVMSSMAGWCFRTERPQNQSDNAQHVVFNALMYGCLPIPSGTRASCCSAVWTSTSRRSTRSS
eukprot:16438599-Heterocapsa_arctica.AAC.1